MRAQDIGLKRGVSALSRKPRTSTWYCPAACVVKSSLQSFIVPHEHRVSVRTVPLTLLDWSCSGVDKATRSGDKAKRARDIDKNPGAGRRHLDRIRGHDERVDAVLQVPDRKHAVEY